MVNALTSFTQTQTWFNDFSTCPDAQTLLLENKVALVVYQYFQDQAGPANQFIGLFDGQSWSSELAIQQGGQYIYTIFLEPSYLQAHNLAEDRPISFAQLKDRKQIVSPTTIFENEANKVSFFSTIVSAVQLLIQNSHKITQLDKDASSGKVSLEQFVERKFSLKFFAEKVWADLANRCQKIWNEKEKLFDEIKIPTMGEKFLEEQESGYLDENRAIWFHNFQRLYCQQHSSDRHSCKNSPLTMPLNRHHADFDEDVDYNYRHELTKEWYKAFSTHHFYSSNLTNSINQALINANRSFFLHIFNELPHVGPITISLSSLNNASQR